MRTRPILPIGAFILLLAVLLIAFVQRGTDHAQAGQCAKYDPTNGSLAYTSPIRVTAEGNATLIEGGGIVKWVDTDGDGWHRMIIDQATGETSYAYSVPLTWAEARASDPKIDVAIVKSETGYTATITATRTQTLTYRQTIGAEGIRIQRE